MKIFIVLFFVICALFVSSGARADETDQFVSVMPDIPVLQGLDEDLSQSMVFDKASGRVAEAVLTGKDMTPEMVESFYAQTLSQLGWKARESGFFVRNGEQLLVKQQKVANGVVLRLSLSPK